MQKNLQLCLLWTGGGMSTRIYPWPDSSSRQHEFHRVPELALSCTAREGCIPARSVAVPCLPAGDGSAGSYTCLVAELVRICLGCCSECFHVTDTSVYSAVGHLEVFHHCQFVLGETEAELQGWRADEKGTEVRYLSRRCDVCTRKQAL